MRSARLRASGPRELPGDRHVSSGVSRVAVNVPADAAAPFYSVSCILPCYKSYYAALKPHNPPEKKRRTIFQFLDISKVCRACNLDQMCPTPARATAPGVLEQDVPRSKDAAVGPCLAVPSGPTVSALEMGTPSQHPPRVASTHTPTGERARAGTLCTRASLTEHVHTRTV